MKPDRKLVYEKFGGKCAYCGCDLPLKGWHVDHVEPLRRNYKYEGNYWQERTTKQRLTIREMNELKLNEAEQFQRFVWVDRRLVPDGCINPEKDIVENMLPSCASCNINKHGDTIEQFRQNIQGYLNSLNKRMVQYKMAKKYGLVEETNKPVVFYFETLNKEPTVQVSDTTKA